jgi:DNA-binding transcriptional LysR family regulator
LDGIILNFAAASSSGQSIDRIVIIHAMNLAGVDLNLLVALDALLVERHLGRAARRVGLSQPAMSHALKRLRHLLGDPLLVRVGRELALTPRAAAVREPLADALRSVRSVLEPDTFDPTTSARRFALMMHDHIAHLMVPELVRRVQREAPGVCLDVLPWRSPFSLKSARLHAIDLVISCSERSLPAFEKEVLYVDTEVMVVRARHPLATKPARLAAFLGASHVAVVGRGLKEDPVDTWLREAGYTRRVALRVPTYIQALQAVARTDLVAVVPRRLARSVARTLSLAIRRPPLDPGQYNEYAFYATRTAHDAGGRWLRHLSQAVRADLDRAEATRSRIGA